MNKLLIAALLTVSTTASAAWTTTSDIDPMTDVGEHYAFSPSIKSMSYMGSTYDGTKSWIGVGCNTEGSVWTYFGFTNMPNMTDDNLYDGYSTAVRAIRWDKDLAAVVMFQMHGSESVQIDSAYENAFIENLKSHNSVILDMSGWYSARNPYFKYSLSGSTASINKVLSKCGIK